MAKATDNSPELSDAEKAAAARKAMIQGWHDCKTAEAQAEFVKKNPTIADIYESARALK